MVVTWWIVAFLPSEYERFVYYIGEVNTFVYDTNHSEQAVFLYCCPDDQPILFKWARQFGQSWQQ